jgi:hypothetical protein
VNNSTDEKNLTFGRFIEEVIPKCTYHNSISIVNPQKTYRVMLVSKIRIGDEYVQSFDEHYLQLMTKELGFNITKTAKIIALRNAWIAYFQEGDIPLSLVQRECFKITNEIVKDYIALTSSKWTDHPRIKSIGCAYPDDDNIVTQAESWDDHHWDNWYKEQEGEIWHAINEFRLQKDKKAYSSELDMNADLATNDIKLAKKKIQEFMAAIEEQEAIIGLAKRHIYKFYNSKDAKNKKAPGRPKLSEFDDQQRRRAVAMEFVEKWINSLMTTLSVSSCGELAKMVGGNKMTWWRWLNKEMLPSSASLEALPDEKIRIGECQNTKLRNVNTSPALVDLITLVALV